MERKNYRWRVSHQEHGTVEVVAPDRLKALTTAAKGWGVAWTPIARACSIEMLGEYGNEKA